MSKKAADVAVSEVVSALMVGIERIAQERITERMDELSERILANLPEVIALPPAPAEAPAERLLTVKQVADMLSCSQHTVRQCMDKGELAYVLIDPNAVQRRVPYSWVVEYIHKLPRHTGKNINWLRNNNGC